jgi:ABC-type lipoprotein release transport system permease subunit
MIPPGFRYWTRIAFLFLARSGRSTVPLSIMVITAVAALIFLSALAVGVNDAMLRNTVGLFSGHITGSGLAPSVLPGDLLVPGVEGVLKRVYAPGVLANGNPANGALAQPLTLCGIDPGKEATRTALHRKIISGGYPRAGRPEVLISQSLARELGVQGGAKLLFSGRTGGDPLGLTVAGIYRTGIEKLDRGIAFIPLDAWPEPPPTWSAAVFLRKGVRPPKIIEAYRNKLPGELRFESWAERMPDLKQLIDLEYISMALVIVLVFLVVSIGIACSFVIFIIKNIREYGIMKTMGVTTGEMSLLIVLKVVLMNALACLTGLLIGGLAVWAVTESGGIDISAFTSHNQYFTVSGIIFPRLTGFSILAPPLASLVFSLLASIWPAALLARSKTADVMRMI